MIRALRTPCAALAAAVVSVLALAAAAPAAGDAPPISPPVDEQLAGTHLTLVPGVPYASAELRISGPAGYALTRQFDSGDIGVDLVGDARSLSTHSTVAAPAEDADGLLADGRYQYELTLATPAGGTVRLHGLFFIESGAAVSRQAVRTRIADVREELRDAEVARQDGDAPVPEPEGTEADFLFIEDTAGDGSTYLELESDTGEDFELTNSGGDLTLETENGTNDLRLTILGADGKVGLGTSTPTAPLEIADPETLFPGIQMDNGGNGWRLSAFSDPAFGVRDTNTFAAPFVIFPGASSATLGIGPGGIGAGTFSPSQPLHVFRSNGSAKLLVEEASGVTAVRELFKLQNNGGPFFVFTDTSLSRSWAFASLASGDFTVNQQQESGIEYRFGQTGNLTIAGTLTENSSRDSKNGLRAVDGDEVLARLRRLPITTWSYDHDEPTRRHMGPMAEEFHELFGLNGSARGIANIDTTGVAFASIQAMARQLEERDERIAELEARVEQMEGLKAEIEELKRLAAHR